MVRRLARIALLTAVAATLINELRLHAQSQSPVEFDVVSIKKNTGGLGTGGGIRTLPDGTFVMTNQPIWSILGAASPVPVGPRQVIGFPDWVMSERYDITAKPPPGMTREQFVQVSRQMWQALFADRMKLAAHVEQQEQKTFALVVARADGRLGPELKPSTLDCSPQPAAPSPAPAPPSASDVKNRCGMAMGPGSIISGGITMDNLVRSLAGLAGGLVNNRTGLQGPYAFTLTYSRSRGLNAAPDAAPDDAPDIFTALQEQLGLKLVPEKTMVAVFVVDHIERPSEN